MNKQKIVLFIAATVLVVLVILVTVVSFYLNKPLDTVPPEELSEVQTPEQLNNPELQISLHVQHVEEHFDEQLPESSPVSSAELILLEDEIPDTYEYVQPDERDTRNAKYSPDKEYVAEATQSGLSIRKLSDNSSSAIFSFEENATEISFVWLQNTSLLLVEKETGDREIDKVYILNTTDKSKTFALGSFPAPTRFNLAVEPARYNNATNVVFTDNEEQKWEMSLSYR